MYYTCPDFWRFKSCLFLEPAFFSLFIHINAFRDQFNPQFFKMLQKKREQ